MVFAMKVFGQIIKMMMPLNDSSTRTKIVEFGFYSQNNVEVSPIDNLLSRMKCCIYILRIYIEILGYSDFIRNIQHVFHRKYDSSN